MKQLERGCCRKNAGPKQNSNPANYKKNGDIKEAEAMRLKISDKETTTIKETGGVTEKHTSAADINTKAIFIASQAMKNHPLGRSSSSCDDHETEPHDFRSQDIYMQITA